MSRWKLSAGLLTTTALVTSAVLAATTTDDGTAAVTADRGGDTVSALFDPRLLAGSICRSPVGGQGRSPYRPYVQIAAATSEIPEAMVTTLGSVTDDGDGPPLWEGLGDLSFPITTDDDLAQRYFDQGLRLTYAFNHAEARRAFRKAQEIDPDCALCYWGEAFVLGPNINAGMDEASNAPAIAAITLAQELAGGASEREQSLIAALAQRYSADLSADRGALNVAYADAMAEVTERFPDDLDIAVLYADSLMNLSPWDYWEADGETPKGRVGEQVATLERVLAANPDHPGAIHLYIHTVEASTTPERAEPFADRLGGLMPAAGHLVHMPSHIYYRIGRYIDSLEANRDAVAADEAYLETVEANGIYPYGYYPHNVHFLLVSAQMSGDGPTTIDAAQKLADIVPDAAAAAIPWVQAIRSAPYFAYAQYADAETILAEPDPGDTFPYIKATWHYMRGIAHATEGDTAAATAESEAIAAIGAAADFDTLIAGGVPAPLVLDLARHVIAGRIAQAEGDTDGAVEAFRQAVAIQDGLPYMEPPYWYYPVRQSLGAALLAAGETTEAEQVFRRSLVDAPNNGWALFGLMRTYEAMGDDGAAAEIASLLERAWAGDSDGLDLARL